jgi:hypothetical protein
MEGLQAESKFRSEGTVLPSLHAQAPRELWLISTTTTLGPEHLGACLFQEVGRDTTCPKK